MYEFDLNQTDNAAAAKDLLRFVEWISTKGLTENVLEVGRGTGIVEGKTNQKIYKEQASKDIYSERPDLKEGSELILKKNKKNRDKLLEYAKKKFGKDIH